MAHAPTVFHRLLCIYSKPRNSLLQPGLLMKLGRSVFVHLAIPLFAASWYSDQCRATWVKPICLFSSYFSNLPHWGFRPEMTTRHTSPLPSLLFSPLLQGLTSWCQKDYFSFPPLWKGLHVHYFLLLPKVIYMLPFLRPKWQKKTEKPKGKTC